jgi:hypothetical protein
VFMTSFADRDSLKESGAINILINTII